MSESVETAPSAAGFAPGTVGVIAPRDPNRRGAFLTDVVTELGFADPATVEQAVDWTKETGGTPESYLLERGLIDEQQLSVAVAERNGLDHIDLELFAVDPDARTAIGKSMAARYSALPIAYAVDRALLVAVEDPGNMLGVSDIEVMTRSEVRLVIATGTQIRRLIDELPDDPPRPPVVLAPLPAEPAAAAEPESTGPRPDFGAADAELGEISDALEEKMRDVAILVEALEQGWRRSAERERALQERPA